MSDDSSQASSGNRKRRRHSKRDDRRRDSDDRRRSSEGHRRHKHSRKRDDAGGSSVDDERRHKKRSKSSNSRREHSSKSSSRHRKGDEKRRSKDHKRGKDGEKGRRQHLTDLGKVRKTAPERPLDKEKDYFTYHQHLWVYLFREEGRAFNDLTSEETHQTFANFVKRYNKGDLEEAYYNPQGMPAQALEECKTTLHTWSFKTNATEERGLSELQDGVRKQTEFVTANDGNTVDESQPIGASDSKHGDKHNVDRNEHRAGRRADKKSSRDRLRESAEETWGISDKPDPGRDRQLAKRGQVAARTHAQVDKEMELSANDIYGGSADQGDFQSALAREKARKYKREEEKRARVAELRQKEDDRKAAMLKQLGLSNIKPGEKITIAPRKD